MREVGLHKTQVQLPEKEDNCDLAETSVLFVVKKTFRKKRPASIQKRAFIDDGLKLWSKILYPKSQILDLES